MKKALFLPLLAALAFAFPTGAGAAIFKGVVIAKQKSRHALVIASRNGKVRTVRTHRMGIRVGTRVRARAARRPDGTFGAKKITVRGRAHRAHVRGVVVRRLRSRILVSAGHSVFAIHTRAGFLPAGGGSNLQTGDEVDATVDVDESGELDEDEVHETGHVDKVELEGTVVSFTAPSGANAGSLVVQVGGLQFTVVVPPGTDLGALKAGDRIEVTASVSGTTLTLVKADQEDENDQGDDDQGDDDNGDDNGGGGDD